MADETTVIVCPLCGSTNCEAKHTDLFWTFTCGNCGATWGGFPIKKDDEDAEKEADHE